MITGSFYVKFMRYLLPLTPFLMVYAAAFLVYLAGGLSQGGGRRRRALGAAAAILVLVASGLYALAIVRLYRTPHPWIEASRWIYQNITPGATILAEQWDDSLPMSLELDGAFFGRSQYRTPELTWLTGVGSRDNLAKLQANIGLLAEANYVVLATNRIYGVVPRLPDHYPLSSRYHRLLFDGRLGYEVVYSGSRFPNLGDYYLKPDTFGWPGLQAPQAVDAYLAAIPGLNGGRVDESFIVYDQPLVIIFENKGRLPAEAMLALCELEGDTRE
jgi:hypothetical protein